MLRNNIFACLRDTREGVRRPRVPTAARSGPYPPLDSDNGYDSDGVPRRPSDNNVGTVHTPVTVLSDRLKVAGSRASAWGVLPTPAREAPVHGGEVTTDATYNSMSAVEDASSGRVLIQQGNNSSGREVDPQLVPLSGQVTANSPRGRGIIEDDSVVRTSTSDMDLVETGPSGRGLMSGDVSEVDLPSVPSSEHLSVFLSRGHGVADDDSRSHSTVRSSTSDMDLVGTGPSGRGLMSGDVLSVRDSDGSARSGFLTFHDMTQRDQPRRGGTVFISSSDLDSEEVGPFAVKASGRTLIMRRGESVEHHFIEPLPTGGQEARRDRPLVGGRVGRGGMLTFGPLRSRAPIESDVPRRGSSRSTMGMDSAAGTSHSSRGWGDPDDCSANSQPGEIDVSSVDESKIGSGWKVGVPRVPWVSRFPAETDLPRRRSVDASAHLDSAAASECTGTDSGRSLGHEDKLDRALGEVDGERVVANERDKRRSEGASRIPWGSRNPTETDLPRRRSVSLSAWDLPDAGSGSSMTDTVPAEEEEKPAPDALVRQAKRPKSQTDGDIATLNASWRNAPTAVDHPRAGRRLSSARLGSESVSTSSSRRSCDSEFDVASHGTVGDSCHDVEAAIEGGDGSPGRRGSRNDGRGNISILAGLVGHKRAPVQSDLPRRRSVEFAVPEGEAALAFENSTSGRDDGSRSMSGEEDDEDNTGSGRSAGRSSGGVLQTGGGRWGLKSRTPVATDLPRRSSGYSSASSRSVGSADAAGGQPLPHQDEEAKEGDVEGARDTGEGAISPVAGCLSGGGDIDEAPDGPE